MKRHVDSGDGWRTVTNRRQDPVTLYVSNIPDGTNTGELRLKFQKFGRIVDIYIAKKKDRGGANFAFIRFGGVQDGKKLENNIGEIRCGHNILHYNLSKYQRKSAAGQIHISHRANPPRPPPPPPPPRQQASRSHGGTNVGMSYVNVVHGRAHSHPSTTTRPPILLAPSRGLEGALQDRSLIGEVIDLDKLRSLPNLLDDEGIPDVKVF